MIRVVILDDEPLAVKQLELYVSKLPYLELAASCTSAAAAREALENGGVDALFVDINMPDISGLDFVRSLDNPPLVVFTTAYSEYALEGFKVNATDYLLKPFSLAEFTAAAEKVRAQVELRRRAAGEPQYITFNAGYRSVVVPLDSIIYVESMSEYVKVFMDGADSPLVTHYSLTRLAGQLPPELFVRIHRSYIVSLKHVRKASRSEVTVSGTDPKGRALPEKSLPVGEIYRPAWGEHLKSMH